MIDYKTTVLIKELDETENILFNFYYDGEEIDAESSLFKFRKLSLEQWSTYLLDTLRNDCNFDLFEIYFFGDTFKFEILQKNINHTTKCNLKYVECGKQQGIPSWILELCYNKIENKSIDDVKTDIILDKTIFLNAKDVAETTFANETSSHEDCQQLNNDNISNDVVHDANEDKSNKLKQLLENHPLDKFVSLKSLFDEDLRDFLKSISVAENNFLDAAIIAILRSKKGIQNSVKYRIAIAPLDSNDNLSEVYFIKTLVIDPEWLSIFNSDNYIVLRYNCDTI